MATSDAEIKRFVDDFLHRLDDAKGRTHLFATDVEFVIRQMVEGKEEPATLFLTDQSGDDEIAEYKDELLNLRTDMGDLERRNAAYLNAGQKAMEALKEAGF